MAAAAKRGGSQRVGAVRRRWRGAGAQRAASWCVSFTFNARKPRPESRGCFLFTFALCSPMLILMSFGIQRRKLFVVECKRCRREPLSPEDVTGVAWAATEQRMRTPPIMRAERTSDGEGRRKKTRGVEASQEGSNEEVFILPFCSCGFFGQTEA